MALKAQKITFGFKVSAEFKKNAEVTSTNFFYNGVSLKLLLNNSNNNHNSNNNDNNNNNYNNGNNINIILVVIYSN